MRLVDARRRTDAAFEDRLHLCGRIRGQQPLLHRVVAEAHRREALARLRREERALRARRRVADERRQDLEAGIPGQDARAEILDRAASVACDLGIAEA
ncbi:hypothetical protein [Amaricoccus sp.]|uniref:hypothetical protein n=1 Tax=Amaricoccus sp. TaxID=1872485 RepID=UPI002C23E28D|nr:hypothetical protein [Amaricoccus sp.]HMR51426.1 hypothetical protein [Amaricoccus sp.]